MPTFKVGDKVRVNWGTYSSTPVWDGEVVFAPEYDSMMYIVSADGCGPPTFTRGGRQVRYAEISQMCWSPLAKQTPVSVVVSGSDPYARASDGMTGGPSGLKWL